MKACDTQIPHNILYSRLSSVGIYSAFFQYIPPYAPHAKGPLRMFFSLNLSHILPT